MKGRSRSPNESPRALLCREGSLRGSGRDSGRTQHRDEPAFLAECVEASFDELRDAPSDEHEAPQPAGSAG